MKMLQSRARAMAVAFKKRWGTRLRDIIRHYAPPEILPLIRHIASQGKYLSKNIAVTSRAPAGSALVIAPHPDDEVIGMGGTLRMLAAGHSTTTVLYLTDGRFERTADMPGEAVRRARREHAESIGTMFNIEQIFWDIRDASLGSNSKTVENMAGILAQEKPDLIFLPSFFDHHYDHIAANQIVLDALAGKPGDNVHLMGYEVWDAIPFPNHIIDISGRFDDKVGAIEKYALSLKEWDYVKLCKCRNALNFHLYVDGRADGYAEAFLSMKAAAYRVLFDDYIRALRTFGANLPKRLERSKRP